MLRGVLTFRERAKGFHQPATAITAAHLARVLTDVGKLDEAESLFRRALVHNEKGGLDPEYSTYLKGCLGGVTVRKNSENPSGMAEIAAGRFAVDSAIASLTEKLREEPDCVRRKSFNAFIQRLQKLLS